MTKSVIEIDGIEYTLKIHVEKRRDVRATLRGRNINVRVPAFLGKKDRARNVAQAVESFRRHVQKNPLLKPKPEVFRKYRDGELLPVGADTYTLQIEHKSVSRSSARLDGDIIRLRVAEGLSDADEHRHVSTLISRCIAKKKQPEIEALVRELNDRYFQKEISSVRLKNNTSNWGSCSKKGNINLSTRLLFAPGDVIEYVIVHELAHLVEMNHSERFWRLVERAVPDHREKRKWLKKHGAGINF